MKISDLLKENAEQQLTEKPMGFLKNVGNRVASAFGSGQAQGRLDTGKMANTLRKEFDVFLGKTGQQPTGDLVLQFLTQKGYPTQSAKQTLGRSTEQPAAAKPATAVQQPQAQPAASQGTEQPAATPEPAADGQQKQNTQQDQKPAANFGQGGYGQTTTNAPAGLTPQQPDPTKQPAADTAPAAKPAGGRTQGGGKVAGQYSNTPNAIRKRAKRSDQRAAHPADDNPNIQVGSESYVRTGSRFFESQLRFYRLLKESLSTKQLDAVFLAAAQDKAKQDAQGGAQQGGGAASGAAQSQQTGQSSVSGMDFAKAAYDGMRGADLGATDRQMGTKLNDKTGRVPKELIDQVNSLSVPDRIKLRAELDRP
jgi:hypothetical protein